MQKFTLRSIVLAMILLGFSRTTKAQNLYNQTSPAQQITSYFQIMTYSFTGVPTSGVFGTAKLYFYYEGAFGYSYEYLNAYDPNSNYIGNVGPTAQGVDCAPIDSVIFSFTPATVMAWGGNATFTVENIFDIDPYECNNNDISARLVINYCTSGTPASTSLASNQICPSSGPITLTGTPAGGTFGGDGVTGNILDVSTLPTGLYSYAYTIDTGACPSWDSVGFSVEEYPMINTPLHACGPRMDTLIANTEFGSYTAWFSDQALTNQVGTGDTFITPLLTQNTTYYSALNIPIYNFAITNLGTTNSDVVDHNALSGDDRGGIAVTDSFVYIVGDDNTARFDLNLTPASGVSLPQRDGIFSDLATGKLYTLYNTASHGPVPGDTYVSFTVDAIRRMNSDLSMGDEVIMLSQPIALNNQDYQCGFFAGMGMFIVYDGESSNWYAVDEHTGNVQNLGSGTQPSLWGDEAWADRGIAEYDGTNYSVLYRTYVLDNSIYRLTIPSGNETDAYDFTDLSDLANFTYAPLSNRWYFHYEVSGQFGGQDETLGYADGTATHSISGHELGCAGSIKLLGFGSVNLGNDTVVCPGTSYDLSAGTGFTSYTWNGTNTNLPTYTVTANGSYYVAVTDSASCTYMDTVNVSFCTEGVANVASVNGVTIYPNPNNGNFTLTLDGWNGNVNITITDVQGKTIKQEQLKSAGTVKENISLSNAADGIYFIKVASDDKQTVYKIQVNK